MFLQEKGSAAQEGLRTNQQAGAAWLLPLSAPPAPLQPEIQAPRVLPAARGRLRLQRALRRRPTSHLRRLRSAHVKAGLEPELGAGRQEPRGLRESGASVAARRLRGPPRRRRCRASKPQPQPDRVQQRGGHRGNPLGHRPPAQPPPPPPREPVARSSCGRRTTEGRSARAAPRGPSEQPEAAAAEEGDGDDAERELPGPAQPRE